jgi:FtsH-binding integral membrane protein
MPKYKNTLVSIPEHESDPVQNTDPVNNYPPPPIVNPDKHTYVSGSYAIPVPVDYNPYQTITEPPRNEKQSRHRFIMKIYTILSLQLLLTFGITLLFVTNNQIKQYVQHSVPMLITAIFSSFVFLIILVCCNRIAKIKPWNYIFLTLFTLSEGYMIGVTSTYYNTNAVTMALIITMIVTIGLTLFACQTKYDFTGAGPYLFCALLGLIGFGILNAIFCGYGSCQVLNILYSLIGAMIFSMYIVYDTQLIIGKNHQYQLSEDEYVFGALTLYLDIINLFIYILQLIGRLNSDD